MADEQITDRIERLVQEEHDLYHRGESEHGLDEEGHRRLQQVRVELDQCYDLLRRRRAARTVGRDPGEADVRDEDTVEGYLQ
jgi:hypothetical protein